LVTVQLFSYEYSFVFVNSLYLNENKEVVKEALKEVEAEKDRSK
jgi:hypothetical protein